MIPQSPSKLNSNSQKLDSKEQHQEQIQQMMNMLEYIKNVLIDITQLNNQQESHNIINNQKIKTMSTEIEIKNKTISVLKNINGTLIQRNTVIQTFNQRCQQQLEESNVQFRREGGLVDVDEMTYQELLQLQNQIGSVNTGLEASKLQNLTRVIFKKSESQEKSTCSICQQQYVDSNVLIVFKCLHSFHQDCCLEYLKMKKVCLLCKADV